MSNSNTPVEDLIRAKITAAFNPQTLEIYNDSHLHSHHKAMEHTTSSETHFRLLYPILTHTLPPSPTPFFCTYPGQPNFDIKIQCILTRDSVVITSDAFNSKMQPARHRMVYALLRDEMAQENGIHALQLRTMTPEEEARQRKKKEDEAAARAVRAEAEEE
ncbi:hypothetical protein FGADI_3732 [Fusarium gaditjirri]|uniref:BolA-like protein n=1 Tax=Fusarium gaditjirri TaxID=282569 RepID=A0A8H4TEQ2_9HYPO|nr:hypothetical protein FGADI_3732 [Fusarium gaditjirri]